MKQIRLKSRRLSRDSKYFRSSIRSLALVIVVSLLFAFQNCADPLDLANQDNASFNKTLPFAFDTQVDTFSYMSCSNMPSGYPQSAYYTFRVGAYGPGSGLRLTQEFLGATANYNTSQRAEALAQSEANVGAILQTSIRQLGAYDRILSAGASDSENVDYENILAPLDSSSIAAQLTELEDEQRISYFVGIPGVDNRYIEGSVRFTQSEASAQVARSKLERENNVVALLYGDVDAADVRIAKGPDPVNSVYGSGFQPRFNYGHALGGNFSPYLTGSIRRVLMSVSEIDLITGRTKLSRWVCPPELRFMIVRPGDLGSQPGLGQAYCYTDAETPTSSNEIYQAIRRVLRMGDWHVDTNRRCVVPKNTGGVCYGRDEAKVNYYGNLAGGNCGQDANGNYTKAKLGDGKTYEIMCPHYVSVCLLSQ